jgi:glycine/D-amino acid oxidase-like deaminating enzyme
MLMDGINMLHKDLKNRNIIGANTGVRLVTSKSKHGRLPFIRKHKSFENAWFVGGFGSHGLIHHALIAEIITESILSNNINNIYQELLEYNLEIVPRTF